MAAPSRFKLRLTKLDLISLVDQPAQESAAIRLIKRKDGGAEEMEATLQARVLKVDSADVADPLAYCWAFTCTAPDGTAYHDLQGDAVQPDFLKVAEEWLRKGGAMDEMHDGKPSTHAAFAFPWDPEIASAMLGPEVGKLVKTSGLMLAVRPTADQLVKLRNKEFNGVSIAGSGIRELIKAAQLKCASCGAYGSPDSTGNCPGCGKAMKRLAKKRHPPVRKQAVLTSAVDGHQHQIDLDDPSDGWSDQLTTSYNTAEGADAGHCHAWVYDETTGAITIAEDSGHTHTVDQAVPADVIRQAQLNESGERCPGCGQMCESDARFCPKCGAAMDRRDAVPAAVSDAGSGSSPSIVLISARAPDAISTPSEATPIVESITKEPPAMANPEDRTRELETKIQDLEAKNAQLQKTSTLTDAARAHLAKLNDRDAISFLDLNLPQREQLLSDIAKADVVVYESPVTGKQYRKSHAIEIIDAAKQADASTLALDALKIEKRDLQLTRRGDEVLSHFAKGAKLNLRTRIMKALDAEFKDPAEFEEAEKAFKSANYALEQLTKSSGVSQSDSPSDVPLTPKAKLDQLTTDYAKQHNVPIHKAAVAILETADGAALYAKLPVGHA